MTLLAILRPQFETNMTRYSALNSTRRVPGAHAIYFKLMVGICLRQPTTKLGISPKTASSNTHQSGGVLPRKVKRKFYSVRSCSQLSLCPGRGEIHYQQASVIQLVLLFLAVREHNERLDIVLQALELFGLHSLSFRLLMQRSEEHLAET